MIALPCPACGREVTVQEEFAGRYAPCPHCNKPFLVPARAPATLPARSAAALPTSAATVNPACADVTAALPDGAPTAHHAGRPRFDFLAPPQERDEMGRLGAYRVLRELGAGGMGIVLLADDPLLKRAVALKVMRPELAADPTNRRRFLREAQATAAIDHPHIVHIYQVGEENGVPFIAMPLLQGETLAARLQRVNRLPIDDSIRIGKQIAEGLAVAHKHGLVHRDVKPANIWLASDGEPEPSASLLVKLLDFGLARSVVNADVELTKSGAILGTPSYMAPEQAKSEAVDARCDLFSLGVVLYRMLTGELPFKGHDTMAVLFALTTDTPKPVRSLNAEVPPALAVLVTQLLAKDPAQRPATAKDVAEALGEIAGDSTTSREGGKPRPLRRLGAALWSMRPSAFRRPGLAFAVEGVVLGLLLLLAALPFLLGNRSPHGGAKGPEKKIANSLDMEFVLIQPGTFTMGSSRQEIERCLKLGLTWPRDIIFQSEGPAHEVEIRQPFYMGAHEVTVGQFRAFVTATNCKIDGRWNKPGFEQTEDHPVVWVSFDHAVDFCNWLSAKEGKQYRLPTEAEWEYCCRAGTTSRYGFGDEEENLITHAWYSTNGAGKTHPVGQREPNAWGLHDMHGNVSERCLDYYDYDYYKNSPKPNPNPTGPGGGRDRVIRGGSFKDGPATCRSAFRHYYGPDFSNDQLGFRVVRLLSSAGGGRR